MKFTVVKDPIPFLIIDDTYNKEEQLKIYNELDFLSSKLQDPNTTGSAIKGNGELKSNKGLFLEDVYRNRVFSDILQINRKIFTQQVIDELSSAHYSYNLFRTTNNDSTLISYYDSGGSYFSHVDRAVITAVTWFYKTPKNFLGGDFKFTDFNLNVEVKNNRTVIFFSSYRHEVSEVSLIQKNIPFSGRFTLSQFCTIN